MPRVQTITTNFTAGEWSPRLAGRVDVEKYSASARALTNCVVMRHGGIRIRPSRELVGPLTGLVSASRIIPFVYSTTDAYVIEIGGGYVRPWKAVTGGALVRSTANSDGVFVAPWAGGDIAGLRYCQGGDTIIVTHPSYPPHRIVRTRVGPDVWVCEPLPLSPSPLGAARRRVIAVTATISATTVGSGRQITTTGAFWMPTWLGMTVSWGGGLARIDAYVSATVVTVTVLRAFGTLGSGTPWVVEGSPMARVKPSGKGPIGSTITLTAHAATWTLADKGRFVEINDGLVEIIEVGGLVTVPGGWVTTTDQGGSSTTTYYGDTTVAGDPTLIVTAVVRRDLSTDAEVIGGGWSLLAPSFNQYDGYPAACTIHQQRLWLAGSPAYPQALWGSRSGLYFDFEPGTLDADAVYRQLDSDETNAIQHLVSDETLIALTYGGEFDLRGGIERAITPLNVQITQRAKVGADVARPIKAGSSLVYVQRGGTVLRGLYRTATEGLDSAEVSVYSEHLLRDGIKCMSWERNPEHVVWIVTKTGKLIPWTRSEENNVSAMCGAEHAGTVLWAVTIPVGDRDMTYCLTAYPEAGAGLVSLERIDWDAPPGQDARFVSDVSGTVPPQAYHPFAQSAIAPQSLSVIGDGLDLGVMPFPTSGFALLADPVTLASVGYPYTARAVLHPVEFGTGSGTSQAQAQSDNRVSVRFLDTVHCNVDGEPLDWRSMDVAPTLDTPPAPFSGVKHIMLMGWNHDDGRTIELTQDKPYPWHVLAVIRSVTVNAG